MITLNNRKRNILKLILKAIQAISNPLAMWRSQQDLNLLFDFKDVLENCVLYDLGCQGYPFNSSNERYGDGDDSIQERFDRYSNPFTIITLQVELFRIMYNFYL